MTLTENKPRILCVDDEPSVLDSISRVLRKDFDITTAQTAEQGKDILSKEEPFAVVLSDFRMPGENGVELLHWVKTHHPNTVRAILSGQMDSQEIINAINNAEIHRFILKPWDNDYLRVQMLEAFQTHSRLIESQRLRRQAMTDPVTQLANHRYFQEQMSRLFDQAQNESLSLNVIMVDVDHFKSFNDRYGHPEGDKLLRGIAQRIESHCPENSLAFRYGGEEFAILVPDVSLEEAVQVAEKLRTNMENEPFKGPFGRPAYVTLSVGVSNYPVHSINKDGLVKSADRALYQSKHQGRNQVTVAYVTPGPSL